MKQIFSLLFIVLAAYSCKSKKTSTVTINKEDIKIPASFTPNNDGQNDVLCFDDVFKAYKTAKIEIYNRWGMLVWETENKAECWNGFDNKANVPATPGVYFYLIKLKDNDKITGSVTLLR